VGSFKDQVDVRGLNVVGYYTVFFLVGDFLFTCSDTFAVGIDVSFMPQCTA